MFPGSTFNMPPPPAKISACRRFLVDSQGRPFPWLADTVWELFHRMVQSEVRLYLADRKTRGFTVLQCVFLPELDGLRVPNRLGQLPLIGEDPERINPAYLEWVKWVIGEGSRMGFTFALLPTWGDKVRPLARGAGPVVFNPEKARTFGRDLAAALRGFPIVWVLGGDRNPAPPDDPPIWSAMAGGIREGAGPDTLVSYHPEGGQSSASFFHAEPWLSFNMLQTGHARKDDPVHEAIRRDLSRHPRKPVIDAEPCYEAMPVEFWKLTAGRKWTELDPAERTFARFSAHKGAFGPHDVRKAVYRALFSGAFGATYGHNAVWQVHTRDAQPPNIPTTGEWKEALSAPGARQMRPVRQLLEGAGYLEPLDLPVPPLLENKWFVARSLKTKGTLAYLSDPINGAVLEHETREGGANAVMTILLPADGRQIHQSRLPARGTLSLPSTEEDLLLSFDKPLDLRLRTGS